MPDEKGVRRLLASDMDGTVIPPERSPENLAALQRFQDVLAASGVEVVYVTGRHLSLAEEGIRAFGLPEPLAVSCDVGTTVYWRRGGAYEADIEYRDSIASMTGVADASAVRRALDGMDGLALQEPEKQSDFKVSYFLGTDFTKELQAALTSLLDPVGRTRLVPSHDPVTGRGLLDVLPARVGKGTAVQHMVRRLGMPPGRTVFSGDSGNDRDAILSGMPSVVVGNAPPELAAELQAVAGTLGFGDQVYRADAPFCEGVIEGLRHFGFLPT